MAYDHSLRRRVLRLLSRCPSTRAERGVRGREALGDHEHSSRLAPTRRALFIRVESEQDVANAAQKSHVEPLAGPPPSKPSTVASLGAGFDLPAPPSHAW